MMDDLSLHILDIAENAISAGATRITVSINENEGRDILAIRVSDNGPGFTSEALRRALDPFFTTKGKRTGLGLPLLAQAAELCGGDLTIAAGPKMGTRVATCFRHGHIDRPPLTNMRGTMMTLVFGHPEIDFRYRHRRNGHVFRFASRRFFRKSGLSSGTDPVLIGRIDKMLRTGLRAIGRT